MQNNLVSLVNIKIDAINKNIDNLNYLNGELEKNKEYLDYIRSKIQLFENNDVLNFDKIDKDSFDRILSMIDFSVSEIFQDKVCNYQGIMYIIQGIRQGISLELTGEQTNAILSFYEGMQAKDKDLVEVIRNLEENKEKLPETDLSLLLVDLEKYKGIITKLDNNVYLTEIDEIIEVLDFSEILPAERTNIFEYILKYNADIYTFQKDNSKEIEKFQEEKVILEDVKVPEFHFEPVNLEEIDNQKEEIPEEKDNIINLNDYGTLQMPIIDANEYEIPSFLVKEETEQKEESIDDIVPITLKEEPIADYEEIKPVLDYEIKEETEPKLPENANILPNTVDLEDIIKKIDAKLKELETTEETKEEINTDEKEDLTLDETKETTNLNMETNILEEDLEIDEILEDKENRTAINEVLLKYNLSNLLEKVTSSNQINTLELDNILNFLNENKILEVLKEKESILSEILLNNKKDKLEELLNLIKENFESKNTTYQYVLDIITLAMPLLLTDSTLIDTFKLNIEFFKEHDINLINLFNNYRELLIIENDLLKDNYEIIIKYQLKLNDDNVKYLLYNKDLIKNIDYYIEAHGYEKGFLGSKDEFDGVEYIEKHPYKLNNISKNTLMKLRYSSENELKIYGSKPGILAGEIANPKVDLLVLPPEYKTLYFNNEYPFMDRSEMLTLLDELDLNVSFDLTLDENLEKLDSSYKISDLRYKIEDILFSRIKTIRLYNFLKNKGMNLKNALIIALTYNSVIKRDEYINIENIINTLIEGGN